MTDHIPEAMIGLGERLLGRRDDIDGEQMRIAEEHLLRDVVPAEVRLPSGERILRARVFITDRRIQVWTESRPPTLAHEIALVGEPDAGIASRHASAGTPHRLSTVIGEVQVLRSRGTCSCKLPGLMGLSWPT